MSELFEWLFGAATFMPHGYCLLWRPDLVALHAGSDFVIAAAYFAIPAAIWAFVRKRADLTAEHRRIAMLFVAFIVACGLTHVMGLVSVWAPLYGAQALVKVATAGVSALTALLVWPLVPKLLAIPSPSALADVNARLSREIEAKNAAVAELERARADLETQVADRTRDLDAKARDAARAAEELRVVRDRFERAIGGSNVTVFEQDRDLRYLWIANPPPELDDPPLLGRTDAETMPAEIAPQIEAHKRAVMETGAPDRRVHALPLRGGRRFFDLDVEPIRRDGAVVGVSAVAVDVTSEKEAHERLELVLREMTHRVKNLFAVIIGLAAQIGRATGQSDAFVKSLVERLQALARAHDVLTVANWEKARLSDIVAQQLGPLDVAGRVDVDPKDDVEVAPQDAQMLALAVHELATNALKHGALTQAGGRVRLGWRRDGDRILLDWREVDGAAVKPPERQGFGRVLLERLVPKAIRGEARLDYAPAGFAYALAFPA